jgi:hypothetical protein
MTTIEYPGIGRRGPATRATTSLRHVLRLGRRAPSALERRAVRERAAISIRHAARGDEAELQRLAELCERRRPAWPLLVAEVDGEIVAAVSVDTPDELRHPFRVTTDLAPLLRHRAEQLRAAGPG